ALFTRPGKVQGLQLSLGPLSPVLKVTTHRPVPSGALGAAPREAGVQAGQGSRGPGRLAQAVA
ncbi:unnamed protein product, partial [Rangifer tarandus platyrhynchus]